MKNPPKIKDSWQAKFLEAGTKNGCGDLSIMIGTVTQIHTQAKEEVKLDTLKWVRARLGDEFNDNFHYKGSDFKDYIDLLSNNKK